MTADITVKTTVKDVKDEQFGDEDVSEVSSIGDVKNRQQQQVMDRLKESLKKQDKTQVVRIWRVIVFLILFVAAVSVCVGLYAYARNKEHESFETSFRTNGIRVIQAFSDGIERKLVAFGSMSNAMTSYVLSTPDVEFPFVTFPNFEMLGADVRVAALAVVLHYAPLVTDDKRKAWEAWAMENRFQVDKAFAQESRYRKTQDEYFANILGEQDEEQQRDSTRLLQHQANQTAQNGSHNLSAQEDPPLITIINNTVQDGTKYRPQLNRPPGSGPYFPRWQRCPINRTKQAFLNSDLSQWPALKDALAEMLKNPKVVLDKASVFDVNGIGANFNNNLLLSQYRQSVEGYIGEPMSFLVYPVFDTFYNATASVQEQRDHLAGMLYSNIYWRLLLEDILPFELKGVICVIENSFNDTIVYRIDGPQVTYLGDQDPRGLYETFEHLGFAQDATAYVKSRTSPETMSYSTVPLHDTFGQYTLRVYPSQDTQNEYTSMQPIIFPVVVAVVFLLTAVVFMVFDFVVERRQRIVMEQALQSGALVNSLFPEQVQSRLYQENQIKKTTTGDSNAWRKSLKSERDVVGGTAGSRPIADHYDEVTVMFGDLAGFTAWSAKRTPVDVFELLESLYDAFDGIALKRGVFKVETIGDCWLGVCGLPEPNPLHAVAVARFASECLLKMNQIVRKVSEHLGADTQNLQLRVGLHSGSVTAGVLRGQKSRFQLFGDTVNTASRMESTGQAGRIHASQSTADELIAQGKSNWVSARDHTVKAKGKGELQTYFITVQGGGSVATSGTTNVTGMTTASGLQRQGTRDSEVLPSTKEGADEPMSAHITPSCVEIEDADQFSSNCSV
ncbi:Receptor-type guanylate cyclase gcy [Seminavis robusta]|uniref:Receptor-type guanylate cyclase gcy n=1 Tax=Seminavis robusta TaxID=568900 RepID=A0A9N8E266_9STRA|nr:Receptor-type guanylate cyclase gcy [Seminavis robusta]|eukprot:Sro482_g151790.1 Receptor-type guanylate cyclase gcy (844) ;mRNA; r:17809-20708